MGANVSATARYCHRGKPFIIVGKTKTTIGYVQAVNQIPQSSFCLIESWDESPKTKIGVSKAIVNKYPNGKKYQSSVGESDIGSQHLDKKRKLRKYMPDRDCEIDITRCCVIGSKSEPKSQCDHSTKE